MDEAEILQRLAEIREEAARIRDSLEPPEATRRRSRILLASTISSVGSLILAPPTGGLTLIIALPGLWACSTYLQEDAAIPTQDWIAKRQPSELTMDYGELVRRARELGHDVP